MNIHTTLYTLNSIDPIPVVVQHSKIRFSLHLKIMAGVRLGGIARFRCVSKGGVGVSSNGKNNGASIRYLGCSVSVYDRPQLYILN